MHGNIINSRLQQSTHQLVEVTTCPFFCIQPITFYFLVYSLYVVSQVVLQLAEGHIYNAHMRKINLLMQLSEINFQKYSSKKGSSVLLMGTQTLRKTKGIH